MDEAFTLGRFGSGEAAAQSAKARIENFVPGPGSRWSSWPRAFGNRFDMTGGGVPEIEPSQLDDEILGAGIVNHGSLLVRGLISPDEAEELRSGIDQALEARDAVQTRGAAPNGWYWPAPVKDHIAKSRDWVENGGAVLTADSPFMLEAVIATFKRTGIIETITNYLGEAPALSIGKSTLRRVHHKTGTDWHQDGNFLGRHVRAVNVWLALSDCGVDAPGLDVVPKRLPYVVQSGTHGAWFDWSVGAGMIDALEEGGTAVVSPHFRAGDALLFDDLMLHRTGAREHHTQQRWAIESWFFGATHFPLHQEPLAI